VEVQGSSSTEPQAAMRIGVDVGGTKIEALAIDNQGQEIMRYRVDTPRGDYRGTVAAIAGGASKDRPCRASQSLRIDRVGSKLGNRFIRDLDRASMPPQTRSAFSLFL